MDYETGTKMILTLKNELDKFVEYGINELKQAIDNNVSIAERIKIITKQKKDAQVYLDLIKYVDSQITK